MADKSYGEILRMIIDACNYHFYTGAKDEKKTIIESATQIYIAQMNNTRKERGGEK